MWAVIRLGPGLHIVTWLLWCWENRAGSLKLGGREARQLRFLRQYGESPFYSLWTCVLLVEKLSQEVQQFKENIPSSPPTGFSISTIKSKRFSLHKRQDISGTLHVPPYSCLWPWRGYEEVEWKIHLRGMATRVARENKHKTVFFQENCCSSFQCCFQD